VLSYHWMSTAASGPVAQSSFCLCSVILVTSVWPIFSKQADTPTKRVLLGIFIPSLWSGILSASLLWYSENFCALITTETPLVFPLQKTDVFDLGFKLCRSWFEIVTTSAMYCGLTRFALRTNTVTILIALFD